MKTKAVIIDPVTSTVSVKQTEISQKPGEVLVNWHISAVCASERRRFNLTKSHDDIHPFVGWP